MALLRTYLGIAPGVGKTYAMLRDGRAQRHAKRWQDVGELLANGVDVYATFNVANLESLSTLVSQVIGVHPAEPVPDAFVRAGEIKLIDLAPSALRHRLTQVILRRPAPPAAADALRARGHPHGAGALRPSQADLPRPRLAGLGLSR